ncbi:hypothetical protein [Oscillatoria acuminata]|uniref:hypothetical protein n=1 Tax=Oscillatoria acuminata TaxID=118323 RepID=UPI0002F4AF7B|nr:hypothetical protein [Oscillatoria acuminata]
MDCGGGDRVESTRVGEKDETGCRYQEAKYKQMGVKPEKVGEIRVNFMDLSFYKTATFPVLMPLVRLGIDSNSAAIANSIPRTFNRKFRA